MICINGENTACRNSASIQKAVDDAKANGDCMVIVQNGEWKITEPVKLYDNIHIHLENAHLKASEDCERVFENYNIILPRINTIYGRQKGITVSGSGDSSISGKCAIYFYNVGDFSVSGLRLEKCKNAIELVYVNHFRISELGFEECDCAISVLAGSRNGFIHDVDCRVCGCAVCFDSKEREEIVYYNGPQVENHIVRNVNITGGEKVRILGDDVRFTEIV